MSSERVEYIDIAKGIGILLVALAHADIAIFSPYLHKLIYAFHMPLFFFLSGYFFNLQIPFWTLVKKRFNTVLKPYFATILLIYIVSLSFSNMRFATVFGRILKALYGTGYYIDWTQLWFLPSLFITSLFAYIFYRLVLTHIPNRLIRWLVLLLILIPGVYFLNRFYPFSVLLLGKAYQLYGLPFNLDIVLVSGFFYILGNETRLVTTEKTFDNLWILAGTGIALVMLTSVFSYTIDFNTRLYQSFPVNTVEAILGILFTLAVSRQIDLRTKWLASALKYSGQASLFILIFHVPIQSFWAPKLLFVTGQEVFSILSAFVISIVISLGFYHFFFERNPIALFWFGRRSSLPAEQPTVPEPAPKMEDELGKKYGEPG